MTRYWTFTLAGLAAGLAALVAADWGLLGLMRTGSCASGGPYVSARPCPPGTGLHVVALVGGILGSFVAVALYAARGRRGAPGGFGFGFGATLWALGFTTLAASALLGAFGPAAAGDAGARTAAVVIAVVFVPLGLAPLPLARSARRHRSRLDEVRRRGRGSPGRMEHVELTAATEVGPAPASSASDAPPGPSPTGAQAVIEALERLADLRERGALTEAEFEAQKRRLLGGL